MPSSIYEALPYIYLVVGASALFGVEAVFGQICGLLLMVIGAIVFRMRIQYRKRESVRDLMAYKQW